MKIKMMQWALVVSMVALVGCDSGTNPDDPPVIQGPSLSSVTLTGGSALTVGQQIQLTASANFSDGTVQNVTSGATYRSSDNAVATVTSSGLVTGVSAGTVSLTATYQGVQGSLPIRVDAVVPAFDLDLTLSRLTIVEDCDPNTFGSSAIVGPGEFTYRVLVRFPGESSFTPVQETVNYPGNPANAISASNGESIALGNGASRTVRVREGDTVRIQLRVTEWDNPNRDTRMADLPTEFAHRFSGGQWSQVGTNDLPLGGTGCRVNLVYGFRARLDN